MLNHADMKSPESPAAFLLASQIMSYPDQNFVASVDALLAHEEVQRTLENSCPEHWGTLKVYLNEIMGDEEALRDLRSLYVDIFERSRAANSLYETEYGIGRSIAKGPELLDIATCYQAFGFALSEDESHREMIDHLAVELEFYGLLGLKLLALKAENCTEGVSILEEGRRFFLTKHLGTFTRSILARPGVQENSYYFHAMSCVNQLVARECLLLGVEQKEREWQEDLMRSEDEISCGSLGGCLTKDPSLQPSDQATDS